MIFAKKNIYIYILDVGNWVFFTKKFKIWKCGEFFSGKPIVDTLKQGLFFCYCKFFIQEGHKIGAKENPYLTL